jgi:uncharacterized membrane protein YqjE
VPTGEGADRLRELGDGVTRLVGEHVELAKAELAQAARRTGRDAALLAGAGLAAALGWSLVAFGVGFGLAERLGLARAFVAVAAAHLAVAGTLAWAASRRLRRGTGARLARTRRELREDRAFLGDLKRAALHRPSQTEARP